MAYYYRTCQECGHIQKDVDPSSLAERRIDSYRSRKCRRCKSESLDWGSISHPAERQETEDEEEGGEW